MPMRLPWAFGVPFVAGKSTAARVLQTLLARWPSHPQVSLVTTDGFLLPLATLEARGLVARKGFPESYDLRALVQFMADIKSGLPEVLRRSTHLAQSPMESRIRIAIEDAGLPTPVLQHRVGPYFFDMAYPERKLAMEYDGREHLTPARARRDLDRQAYVTRAGWTVLRFPAAVVLGEPWRIGWEVRSMVE